jgi:hypothetical protein
MKRSRRIKSWQIAEAKIGPRPIDRVRPAAWDSVDWSTNSAAAGRTTFLQFRATVFGRFVLSRYRAGSNRC